MTESFPLPSEAGMAFIGKKAGISGASGAFPRESGRKGKHKRAERGHSE